VFTRAHANRADAAVTVLSVQSSRDCKQDVSEPAMVLYLSDSRDPRKFSKHRQGSRLIAIELCLLKGYYQMVSAKRLTLGGESRRLRCSASDRQRCAQRGRHLYTLTHINEWFPC
jgi:hypothetical protein